MEMELPILTEENYYDDVFYMSNSRFKEYIACPLRQQAIDLGFWKGKKSTDALLLGNKDNGVYSERSVFTYS